MAGRWVGNLLQNGSTRRALAWGLLGLLCFAISAWLTNMVAHVTTAMSAVAPDRLETSDRGWYGFSVLAAPGTLGRAAAHFDYTTLDSVAVLTFRLPEGSKALFVLGVTGGDCRHKPSRAGTGGDAWVPLKTVRLAAPSAYSQVTLDGVVLGDQFEVQCNVQPEYLEETFTTTVAGFFNSAAFVALFPDVPLMPVDVELTLNSRDGPAEIAAAANGVGGDVNLLRPHGFVVVRFHSFAAAERRDWLIVLIGTFIGFGAAMCIEAIRPVVERLGGEQ